MGTVFIIDDSDFDRRMIRRALEGCPHCDGVGFSELPGGAGALERVARERPRLTILDIRMPGMDGFEVLDAIRSRPDTREATVIMLSGSTQDRDMARERGADAYFVKPARATGYMELGRHICRDYVSGRAR